MYLHARQLRLYVALISLYAFLYGERKLYEINDYSSRNKYPKRHMLRFHLDSSMLSRYRSIRSTYIRFIIIIIKNTLNIGAIRLFLYIVITSARDKVKRKRNRINGAWLELPLTKEVLLFLTSPGNIRRKFRETCINIDS